MLDGNICALQGTKDHVSLFIYDPIADDLENVINQGSGNLTARAIQMYENDKLSNMGILELIRNIVANNRTRGGRKIIKIR